MSRFPTPERRLAVGCALVFSTLLGLALLGFAQIVSTYEWCTRDAARQLDSNGAVAELRLGSQPAVLCRSASRTLEMPVGPTVVTVVLAVLGMAISLFTVIGAVRRAHAAQPS